MVAVGKLYLIGTPIGNLQDISERVRATLNDCDVVFVEDTRVSIKLMNHLGLNKKLISCYEHNQMRRAALLKEFLLAGKAIGLITDAGMPLVCDPGHELVQTAISLNCDVIPIPGPSAILLALVGSGLPCERFVFEGFLPGKSKERKKSLASLLEEERTIVLFIAPHDVLATIKELASIMPSRRACLCRELTKLHEEFIRADLEQMVKILEARTSLKGEMVLVIAGAPPLVQEISEQQIMNRLSLLFQDGIRLKEASTMLSRELNVPSSLIYSVGLKLKRGEEHHA